MYYRVEVNPQNIGTVVETPFSLNPTRVNVAQNKGEWQFLSQLVDKSLSTGYSLFKVCNEAVEKNPNIWTLLPGIWEVMFERSRPSSIPVRRTDCAFFFKKKENALNFHKTYPGMQSGQLCKVDIIKEVFSKEVDMNWLESIDENTATAMEIIQAFGNYWNGIMTSNPIVEVLFVGKYKLNPIK